MTQKKEHFLFVLAIAVVHKWLKAWFVTYFLIVRCVSAGIVSTLIHPVVKELMAEIEMPLEGHVSNCVDEYLNDHFDVVITLCDKAKKHCPPFPHCDHHVHWPFRDPITFAGQHKDVLKGFRDVRDLIVTQFNDCFLDELN